jgi:ankyrin repeat protein
MRLVVATLFAGNITFNESDDGESCILEETEAALKFAALLGVPFEGLASALTEKMINAGVESVLTHLNIVEAIKACEALIKAVYGAAFDFIVERVNASIVEDATSHGKSAASIGVLDIFGFETFQTNNFEQICINYTNEALQQQFNKYVFKLEQQEYEKEGILWKFISFPDNQDVLDLIDKKHTGILALLDEQCILPKSTDQKFTRYLYGRCDKHPRFNASSAQRVDYKFSIEHYAGFVEYTTDGWLEKNKDQLPAAAAELLLSSDFELIGKIRKFVRSEDRAGRGTVATKSVGAQFSTQLKLLRSRIDSTVPHYIRCLKPNDELIPDYFEPKNVVEQLRCGGVLEAVRVSRAGYPTRYPHDVFIARYYILGDTRDMGPVSPIFTPERFGKRESDLKRLISKIAFDLWYTDFQIMQTYLENEKKRKDSAVVSPKYQQRPIKKAEKPRIVIGDAAPYVPPFNLVVESSVSTPDEKTKKNRKSSGFRKEADQFNIARPQSEREFLELDFSSRCAVAGLQLGRTKVFLRREAFDRIEALRSEKFFTSAAIIQKIVRGRACRIWYQVMRMAAIIIQSLFRMKLSRKLLSWRRIVRAAIKVQSTWRMAKARSLLLESLHARRDAIVCIQRFYRNCRNKKLAKKSLMTKDAIIRAVTMLQAMYRGGTARAKLLADATSEPDIEPEMEPSPEKLPSPIIEPPKAARVVKREVISPKLAPVESRVITNRNGTQADLFRYISEENWSQVEHILDNNPELAELSDPQSGELPLHMIARHTGSWTLLIDMILVLYPKALIHRDNMGALPIHHAAAHDNLSALEIIYGAYKEGINDVDRKGRLPIHVAAEFDAVDTVKFLLSKSPEGAYTMVYRPPNNSGGGLPLHIACRNYASIGVITALLAENFASAKRTDENGDLPIHLLLRCGEVVDQVVIKTLLTCFSSAVSRTDMYGDLPLSIAIKHQCRSAVVNTILMQFPEAAGVLNGDGHSPLFLAFKHNADDRTIMGLLNHAPEVSESYITNKDLFGANPFCFSLLVPLIEKQDFSQSKSQRKMSILILSCTIC